MVSVKNVTDSLSKNGIRFRLCANDDTVLLGPIDWQLFAGEGLAFYVGNDSSQLCKWEDPAQGLIICDERLQGKLNAGPFLFVEKPRLSFIVAAQLFVKPLEPGIHPSAVIDPRAKIGKNVSIGALSVVGVAEIGDETTIGSLVSITDNVKIGKAAIIMNGVHLGDPCLGSVVDQAGNLILFPHFESVHLGDKVVIGPATVIGRGVLTPTRIGRGSHIAAHCTIGHNCQVGQNVYMSLGVSLAGRAHIGDKCYLGVGCCIREGVHLAESVTVGMNVAVTRSVTEKGTTLMGVPAKELGLMFGWVGL